jgi:hypothetical protein
MERVGIEGHDRLVVGRDRDFVEMPPNYRSEQVDVPLIQERVLEVLAGAARELGAGIHHVHRAAGLDELARERATHRARADDQDVNLHIFDF